MHMHFKQTDEAADNLQISIQKDSRPNEFSRPLKSITLNLNRDLPVDRAPYSLSNAVSAAFDFLFSWQDQLLQVSNEHI